VRQQDAYEAAETERDNKSGQEQSTLETLGVKRKVVESQRIQAEMSIQNACLGRWLAQLQVQVANRARRVKRAE